MSYIFISFSSKTLEQSFKVFRFLVVPEWFHSFPRVSLVGEVALFVFMLPLLPQASIHLMKVLMIKAKIAFFVTISRPVSQCLCSEYNVRTFLENNKTKDNKFISLQPTKQSAKANMAKRKQYKQFTWQKIG